MTQSENNMEQLDAAICDWGVNQSKFEKRSDQQRCILAETYQARGRNRSANQVGYSSLDEAGYKQLLTHRDNPPENRTEQTDQMFGDIERSARETLGKLREAAEAIIDHLPENKPEHPGSGSSTNAA